MSLAIPINKFISNHDKILLKEIKYMKIDRRKKKNEKPMTIHRSVWQRPLRVCSSCLSSFTRTFSNEYALIYVKHNNWELKSVFNKLCLWNNDAPPKPFFRKLRPWYLTLTGDLELGTNRKLLLQGIHVKYEGPKSYQSKDLANVKVFEHKPTEAQTNGQVKNCMPLINPCRGMKTVKLYFLMFFSQRLNISQFVYFSFFDIVKIQSDFLK